MMASSTTLVVGQPALPSQSRYSTCSRAQHKPRLLWLVALLTLTCCSSMASAYEAEPYLLPAPTDDLVDLGDTLLVDTRVPVLENGRWTMVSQEENDLRRRAASGGSVTTTFSIAVSTSTSQSTTSTVSASPLPSPFDSSLASNFTQPTCPAFINWFLSNPTFKQCYPFSLLLQSSQSFFEAEQSLVSTTQVLDASCAANATFCSGWLNQLAKNLTDPGNCGSDYQLGNAVVVQAYIGLISYPTLYSASCLKDPQTSVYCFANAVTNLTTPANVYLYYLPLNMSMPGSSIPTCNWCTQQTMAVYQSASGNRKQPIVNTYQAAAQQVNTICGPNFVNQSLPAAIVTNSATTMLTQGPSWLLLSSLLIIAMQLLS